MNKFLQNNKNATILKIIKIFKICHSRLVANDQKFLSSHSVHKKCDTILHPPYEGLQNGGKQTSLALLAKDLEI